ncbi:hypothetical protein EN745_13630 [Mesorhizobium sp. M4A.F.Ca.ET.022.05.2.1]|uniref:hypothetical protein n=1 Tax=Mesorhizobium sp. M4A.F.Ca.ET.022.05.2.1 TaxID=2496653 RepID=UPI000FCC3B00|nr:hypothetical protein [Mesorhizobium sp. M4A.F.Ca.ET.022.05.2.1]RVC80210.1 hypothetical protein EN745_13630 [Mesorhizobium sp. M4A.F.Ca.ET.022.05.2.1]
MLARLKPAAPPNFATLLTLPEKPASIAEAEEALRIATAARQEAQGRHIEAGRQYFNQVAGQPPRITAKEVDEIGATLQPLFDAESNARARRDEEIQAFEASIGPTVLEPIGRLRTAIDEAIDHLETLLGHGAAFRARAVAAGVDLSKISRLPGICAPTIERLGLVRAALKHADRN